jgi:HK97 family phage major capsid protein
MNLQDLDSRLLDLNERAEAITTTASAELRDMTDEEGAELDRILNEAKTVGANRERIIRLDEFSSTLSASLGRRTDPDDVVAAGEKPGRKVFAQPRNPEDKSNHGFPSFGQFAKSVMLASRRSNPTVDPRLVSNAPTSYGQEGVGEDGGFAVPPDFRSSIMRAIQGEESLLSRTDQQQSSSNVWSQPIDETTPWQTSGGIRAYWEGEGQQLTQSKPVLKQTNLRLHKLTALVPVTEELREDAAAIDNYLRSKTPEAFDFAVTNAIINGDGVGKPLGILNSPALVTVAKETNQTAATLHARNIAKMWGRMYAPYRRDAVWLCNQDVESELPRLAEAAVTPDSVSTIGTTGTYWAPGSARNANDFGLLYNRPVIITEACAALGAVGDIVLASLSQYLTVTKVGGMRSEVSDASLV